MQVLAAYLGMTGRNRVDELLTDPPELFARLCVRCCRCTAHLTADQPSGRGRERRACTHHVVTPRQLTVEYSSGQLQPRARPVTKRHNVAMDADGSLTSAQIDSPAVAACIVHALRHYARVRDG